MSSLILQIISICVQSLRSWLLMENCDLKSLNWPLVVIESLLASLILSLLRSILFYEVHENPPKLIKQVNLSGCIPLTLGMFYLKILSMKSVTTSVSVGLCLFMFESLFYVTVASMWEYVKNIYEWIKDNCSI